MTIWREVYDPSAKISWIALNGVMTGCTRQSDLLSPIIRTLKLQFGSSADGTKVFHRSRVYSTVTLILHSLLRKSHEFTMAIRNFASAPLFTRKVLHKLSQDEQGKFSTASSVVEKNFCIDTYFSRDAKLWDNRNGLPQPDGIHLHSLLSVFERHLTSILSKVRVRFDAFTNNGTVYLYETPRTSLML